MKLSNSKGSSTYDEFTDHQGPTAYKDGRRYSLTGNNFRCNRKHAKVGVKKKKNNIGYFPSWRIVSSIIRRFWVIEFSTRTVLYIYVKFFPEPFKYLLSWPSPMALFDPTRKRNCDSSPHRRHVRTQDGEPQRRPSWGTWSVDWVKVLWIRRSFSLWDTTHWRYEYPVVRE